MSDWNEREGFRNFEITYKKKNKYDKVSHKVMVSVQNPTGDIGRDAKNALNLFISLIGSLKKYDVLSIQEYIGNEPYGLPITPQEETTIVPAKRK